MVRILGIEVDYYNGISTVCGTWKVYVSKRIRNEYLDKKEVLK